MSVIVVMLCVCKCAYIHANSSIFVDWYGNLERAYPLTRGYSGPYKIFRFAINMDDVWERTPIIAFFLEKKYHVPNPFGMSHPYYWPVTTQELFMAMIPFKKNPELIGVILTLTLNTIPNTSLDYINKPTFSKMLTSV